MSWHNRDFTTPLPPFFLPLPSGYVWSQEIIPLYHRLSQALDGLFRVALSSLSFALVQLDSYVQGLGLRVLKARRDIVFSQAVRWSSLL